MKTNELTITQDSGLTPHQQRQREQVVVLWAHRILWLQGVSGATVRTALQAIEDAEYCATAEERNAS